jgi:hypothetical protein
MQKMNANPRRVLNDTLGFFFTVQNCTLCSELYISRNLTQTTAQSRGPSQESSRLFSFAHVSVLQSFNCSSRICNDFNKRPLRTPIGTTAAKQKE